MTVRDRANARLQKLMELAAKKPTSAKDLKDATYRFTNFPISSSFLTQQQQQAAYPVQQQQQQSQASSSSTGAGTSGDASLWSSLSSPTASPSSSTTSVPVVAANPATIANNSTPSDREVADFLLKEELPSVVSAFSGAIAQLEREVERNETPALGPHDVMQSVMPVLSSIVEGCLRHSSVIDDGVNSNNSHHRLSAAKELWSQVLPKLIDLLAKRFCCTDDASTSSSSASTAGGGGGVHPTVRRSAARVALLVNAMDVFMTVANSPSTSPASVVHSDEPPIVIVRSAVDFESLTGDLSSAASSSSSSPPASPSAHQQAFARRDPFGAVPRSSVPHTKCMQEAQFALRDVMSPAMSGLPSLLTPYVRAVQCALFNTVVYPRLYERNVAARQIPSASVHATVVLHFLRPLLVHWSANESASATALWADEESVARVLCTSALLPPISDGPRLSTPGTSTAGLRTLAKVPQFFSSAVVRAIMWLAQMLEAESPPCRSLVHGLETDLTSPISPEVGLLIRHGQSWAEIFLEFADGRLGGGNNNNNNNNNHTHNTATSSPSSTPSTTALSSSSTPASSCCTEDARKVLWILGFFVTACAKVSASRQRPCIAAPCFVGATEKFWSCVFAVTPPRPDDLAAFSSYAVPLITEVNHFVSGAQQALSTMFIEVVASFVAATAALAYDPTATPLWPANPITDEARAFMGAPAAISAVVAGTALASSTSSATSSTGGSSSAASQVFVALMQWIEEVLSKSQIEGMPAFVLLRSVCEACLSTVLGSHRRKVNPISVADLCWTNLVRAVNHPSQKLAFLAAEAIASLLNHSVNVFGGYHDEDVARNLSQALMYFLELQTTAPSPTRSEVNAMMSLRPPQSQQQTTPSASATPQPQNIDVLKQGGGGGGGGSSPATTTAGSWMNNAAATGAGKPTRNLALLRVMNRLFSSSDGFLCIAEQPYTHANAELIRAVLIAAPSLVRMSAAEASITANSQEFRNNMGSAILALHWQWHFQPSLSDAVPLSTVVDNINRICDRPMETRLPADWFSICGYLATVVLDHATVDSDESIHCCGAALDQLCKIASMSDSPALSAHASSAFRLIMNGFACAGFTEMMQNLMRFIISAMCALVVRQLPLYASNSDAVPRVFFALSTLLHAVTFRCGNSWSSFATIIELTRFCRREPVHGTYAIRVVGSVELLTTVDKATAAAHQNSHHSTSSSAQTKTGTAADAFSATSIVLSPTTAPWHANADDDTDAHEEETDETALGSPMMPPPPSSSSSGGGGGGGGGGADQNNSYWSANDTRFERRVRSMARELVALCLTTLAVPNAPPPIDDVDSVALWDTHAGRTIGCTSSTTNTTSSSSPIKKGGRGGCAGGVGAGVGVDPNVAPPTLRYVTIDDFGCFEWNVAPLLKKDLSVPQSETDPNKIAVAVHREEATTAAAYHHEQREGQQEQEQQRGSMPAPPSHDLTSAFGELEADMLAVRGSGGDGRDEQQKHHRDPTSSGEQKDESADDADPLSGQHARKLPAHAQHRVNDIHDYNWGAMVLESIGCLAPSEQQRRITPWRTSSLRVIADGLKQQDGSFYQRLREIPSHRNRYSINLVVVPDSFYDVPPKQQQRQSFFNESAAKLILLEMIKTPTIGGIEEELSDDGLHGLRRTATEEFHVHVVPPLQSHASFMQCSPSIVVVLAANHRDMYDIAAAMDINGVNARHGFSSDAEAAPILFAVPLPSSQCTTTTASPSLSSPSASSFEQTIKAATFVSHVKRHSPSATIFPLVDGAPVRGLDRLAMMVRAASLVPGPQSADSFRYRRRNLRMSTGVSLQRLNRSHGSSAVRPSPAVTAATNLAPKRQHVTTTTTTDNNTASVMAEL